jgi:hypothetical protein
MAFEKWKAKSAPRPLETMRAVAGALARLRYGPREKDVELLASAPRRISGPAA